MMMFENSKYNWLLILVVVLTPYFPIAFMTFKVDPMIQMLFWFFYFTGFIIFFVTVPQFEYKKHQQPCDGSLFVIGPLVYMDYTSGDMLLGYEKKVQEIKIDWTNSQFKLLEASTIYQRSVQTVASKISKNFREQTRLYKTSKPVDEIMKGLSIDPSLPPIQQLAQAAAIIFKKEIKIAPDVYADKIQAQIMSNEEKKIEENVNEAIKDREELIGQFIPEPPDVLESSEGTNNNEEKEVTDNNEKTETEESRAPTMEEIEKAKEEYINEVATETPLVSQPILPTDLTEKEGEEQFQVQGPEFPTFESLGIPSNEQIKLLKSSYIYLVDLYHPEVLEGREFLEFEQAYFILPGPIQEVLSTRKMKVEDHDGYPVSVQGCSVLMCCWGYIIGRIPLIQIYATENLLKFQDMEAIKANAIQYSSIHLGTKKVLEDIIYKLLSEQDPFHKRIQTLEAKNDALADYTDYLIQDIKADTYIKSRPDIQRANQRLEVELERAKKWKPLTIFLAIAVCIMLFIMAFVLAPATTSSSSVNKPPKKSSLVDFYYLISFLKFLLFTI